MILDMNKDKLNEENISEDNTDADTAAETEDKSVKESSEITERREAFRILFEKIDPSLCKIMNDMNFFTALNVKDGRAYSGSLFDVSKEFANALIHISQELNVHWMNKRSPVVIGMFAMLHKIDEYMIDFVDDPSVEQSEDGERAKRPVLVKNENTLLEGEGEKTIMILSQFMTLTPEEIVCLRHYNSDITSEQFKRALKTYPNLLYVRMTALAIDVLRD